MNITNPLFVDLALCARPLCADKGNARATHELVFGNQILPICDKCAEDALKQEGFARVPDTDIIVMQILDPPDDMHEGLCGEA